MSVATTAAIMGGLGSIYSQWRAGQEAQRGQKEYQRSMDGILSDMKDSAAGQREDIARYLEPDVHRNYMDTAEAQSVMEGARGTLRDMTQKLRGGVARSGATTEAALAGQESVAGQYADIVNRLAGHGTQYKQNTKRTLMGALSGWRGAQHGASQMEAGMAQNKLGLSQQKAGQHAQAGQGWLQALLDYSATDPQWKQNQN